MKGLVQWGTQMELGKRSTSVLRLQLVWYLSIQRGLHPVKNSTCLSSTFSFESVLEVLLSLMRLGYLPIVAVCSYNLLRDGREGLGPRMTLLQPRKLCLSFPRDPSLFLPRVPHEVAQSLAFLGMFFPGPNPPSIYLGATCLPHLKSLVWLFTELSLDPAVVGSNSNVNTYGLCDPEHTAQFPEP